MVKKINKTSNKKISKPNKNKNKSKKGGNRKLRKTKHRKNKLRKTKRSKKGGINGSEKPDDVKTSQYLLEQEKEKIALRIRANKVIDYIPEQYKILKNNSNTGKKVWVLDPHDFVTKKIVEEAEKHKREEEELNQPKYRNAHEGKLSVAHFELKEHFKDKNLKPN